MSIGRVLAGAGVAREVWDKMDRQKEADDYNKETHALNLEEARANNQLLPARNVASVAKFGLAGRQAQAAMGNVDREAAVRGQELDVEGEKLSNLQNNLPTIFGADTDTYKAKANAAKVELAKSGIEVEQIPDLIRQARAKGAIDDQKAGLMSLVGFQYARMTGDDKAVLEYANRSAKAGLVKGYENKTFTKVEDGTMPTQMDEQGQPVMAPVVDANGNPVLDPATGQPKMEAKRQHVVALYTSEDEVPLILSWDKIKELHDQVNPGDYVHIKSGEAVYRNRDGKLTEVAKNTADIDKLKFEYGLKKELEAFKAKNGTAKSTALIANMEYLVKSGVVADHKEAFEKLRTAVEKPEEDATLALASTLLSKGTGYRGKDGAAKALEDARRMVQAVRSGSSSTGAAEGAPGRKLGPPATGGEPKLSPKAEQILQDLGVTP